MKGLKADLFLAALLLPFTVTAEPTESFSKAKKLMMDGSPCPPASIQKSIKNERIELSGSIFYVDLATCYI